MAPTDAPEAAPHADDESAPGHEPEARPGAVDVDADQVAYMLNQAEPEWPEPENDGPEDVAEEPDENPALDVDAQSDEQGDEPGEIANTDSAPPWLAKFMEDSDRRHEALVTRMMDMFERRSAPPAPESREVEPAPTTATKMAEALALDDGDPDKGRMIQAAAMSLLRDDFPDEDSRGRADQAGKMLDRGLAKRRRRSDFEETLRKVQDWQGDRDRERETTQAWKSLAARLPASADTDDVKTGFPHARHLFADPSVLEPYVLAHTSASKEPGKDAFGKALGELDTILEDVGNDPAELRVAARLMRRKDGPLADVLQAYAERLSPDGADQPADKPLASKGKRKPRAPRGASGGKTADRGADHQVDWMLGNLPYN